MREKGDQCNCRYEACGQRISDLEAKVAELEKELKKNREFVHADNKIIESQSQLQAEKEIVQNLRKQLNVELDIRQDMEKFHEKNLLAEKERAEAYQKFAQHFDYCQVIQNGFPCNCGYDDLIEAQRILAEKKK